MSKWKLVPVEATDQMIDAALDAKIGGKVLSCAEIYCAMLDAAPVPVGDDCTSVCDAYAAENQQFSDELARLRAENERLKADAARQADPGELANAFARGHDEGINDCLRNGLDWAHEYMGGQPGKRAKSEQHLSRAERLLAAMQSVIDACDGSYETPGEYGVQVARAIEDMLAAMAQGKCNKEG